MILASDFSAATPLALLTAAMYLWAALRRNLVSQRAARLGMFAAWLCHAAVLALGFGLGGDPAHFGFGPAMSMTAWLVLGIYGVETWVYPQLPTRWSLGAAGAVFLLVAAAFPGHALPERGSAPSPHPPPAVPLPEWAAAHPPRPGAGAGAVQAAAEKPLLPRAAQPRPSRSLPDQSEGPSAYVLNAAAP